MRDRGSPRFGIAGDQVTYFKSGGYRSRVLAVTTGAVFGSTAFVDDVFERYRSRFNEKKMTGARPMKEPDWAKLNLPATDRSLVWKVTRQR